MGQNWLSPCGWRWWVPSSTPSISEIITSVNNLITSNPSN